MSDVRQKVPEYPATHMNKAGVVASLEIDLRRVRQALIDNDLEPTSDSKRGHGARFIIAKERFDLLLVGNIHIRRELRELESSRLPIRGRAWSKPFQAIDLAQSAGIAARAWPKRNLWKPSFSMRFGGLGAIS